MGEGGAQVISGSLGTTVKVIPEAFTDLAVFEHSPEAIMRGDSNSLTGFPIPSIAFMVSQEVLV